MRRLHLVRSRSSHQSQKLGMLGRRNTIATPAKLCHPLQQAIFGANPVGHLEINIQAYAQHIAQQIQEWDLVHGEFLATIATDSQPKSISEIASRAISTFKSFEHTDPTINDVVAELCVHYRIQAPVPEPVKAEIRELVFAAFGWATMLYTPVTNDASQQFCIIAPMISGRNLSSQLHQNANISTRPVAAMLRGFGIGNANRRTVSDAALPLAPEEGSGRVQTSNLHYFCLWHIGGISVRWVDNLDNHLCFDPTVKVLMLFRFPSFCILQLQNPKDILLENFLQSINHADSSNIVGTQSYLREVLLSYRILFGNDSKSRKLFRTKERHQLQQTGSYDQGLDDLCGRDTARSRARNHVSLHVDSVYNAAFDFPHLGTRLLKLHTYSVAQNPSKLKELWDDRRNPLQWFTFWAVIFVGGISILLGVIQTGLSIGQLVVTMQGSTCTCTL